MPRRPIVLHLIDDTTAGGVMRVLDHITTSPEMAKTADHRLVPVTRGRIDLTRYHCDVIVSHLAISWRSLPMFAALKVVNRHARLVHVEHSYTDAFVRNAVPNTGRFHTLLRTAFRLFDTVIAVSHGQASWMRRESLCHAGKLTVIRSCVELSAFESVAPARRNVRVIGAIGRLDRQKGFDTLIAAFRQVRDTTLALHIHGTGDEMDRLKALAKGDTRIRFMGHTPDPLAAHADIDLLIVPSAWEAYGLVAIEALCAGRPVLCADVDGLRDHAEYGAQIMRDTSPNALAHQIEGLVSGSRLPPQDGIARRAEAAFVNGWEDLLTAPERDRTTTSAPLAGRGIA